MRNGYLYVLVHGKSKYLGQAFIDQKNYIFNNANPDGVPIEDFGNSYFSLQKITEKEAEKIIYRYLGIQQKVYGKKVRSNGGISLAEAKALRPGSYIHHPTKKNADGTPMRARVTSVKTWKRDPSRVEIHFKHGMYDYGVFTEKELDQVLTGYGS